MGSDLGKIISSFSNVDLNFGGSAGAMAKVGEQVVSLLAGGEGDSSLFSKAGEALGNLKTNFHNSLEPLTKEDGPLASARDTLSSLAKTIDDLEIPDQVHNAIAKMKTDLIDSGIIGDVAGTVLGAFYSLKNVAPPPFNTIISSMESVISPDMVTNLINNTLNHIDDDFCQKLDDPNSAFTAMRKQVYKTLSLENVVEVTSKMAMDIAKTTYLATGDDATPEEIFAEVKKQVAAYADTKTAADLKDLGTKVGPAAIEALKTGVQTGVEILKDPSVKATAESVVNNGPTALMASGQAIWQSLSGIVGMFGGLK